MMSIICHAVCLACYAISFGQEADKLVEGHLRQVVSLNSEKSFRSFRTTGRVEWKPGATLVHDGFIHRDFSADGWVRVHLNLTPFFPVSSDKRSDFRIRLNCPDASDVLLKFTPQPGTSGLTTVQVIEIPHETPDSLRLVRQANVNHSFTSITVQYRYGQVEVHTQQGLSIVAYIANGGAAVSRFRMGANSGHFTVKGLRILANAPLDESLAGEWRKLDKWEVDAAEVAGNQPAEAIRLRQAVASRYLELLGERHFRTGVAIRRLAETLLQANDIDNATANLSRALQILNPIIGDVHPEVSECYRLAAVRAELTGEVSRALRLYQVTRFKHMWVRGESDITVAELDCITGRLIGEMGDFRSAELVLQQAAASIKRSIGTRTTQYGEAMEQLGALYLRFRKLDQADIFVRQALALRRELHGESSQEYGDSLSILAALRRAQGRLNEARTVAEQSIEIGRAAYGELHPRFADRLSSLALILENAGEYQQAEECYNACLKIRQRSGGTREVRHATILRNLAGLYETMGQRQRATPLFFEAAHVVRDSLDRDGQFLNQYERHLTERRHRTYLDTCLSSVIETGADVSPLLELIWKWQSAVTLRRRALRRALNDPDLAPLQERLKAINHRITLHLKSVPRRDFFDDTEQYLQAVETWGRALDRMYPDRSYVEDEIASRTLISLSSELTTTQLRKALPPESAYVEFVEYNHARTEPNGMGKTTYQRRYAAFVLVGDATPVVVSLGTSDQVNQLVDAALQRIRGEKAANHAATAALKELIWTPIATVIGDAETIIVSPDGRLGDVPLAALPGEKEGFLLEEYRFIVAPMPHLIAELSDVDAQQVEPQLLLVGDIDYDGEERKLVQPAQDQQLLRQMSQSRWESLPGFREESACILDIFQKTFANGTSTTSAGLEASEEAVLQLAQSHSVIHIVTHGYFESPTSEDLAEDQFISQLVPGFLSGLAFAGANQPYSAFADGGDGLLRAAEVEDITLDNVDLCVLSACETALGKPAAGAGVIGLQRAFHIAGVRSVVASLWKVDDQATQELMKQFYNNLWVRKMSRIDALREAQLWLLRHPKELAKAGVKDPITRGRPRKLNIQTPDVRTLSPTTDPFFWAAFQLSGDWR